jgi:hypothetical protein
LQNRALKHNSLQLRTVLAIQFLTTFFYLGMEWLFFATKASFMDSFTTVEMLGTFLIPPALVSLVALPLILLLGSLKNQSSKLQMPLIVPAFFLASSLLLLADNFLYTLFKIGIVTSGSIHRLFFLLLFLLLLTWGFRWLQSVSWKLVRSGNQQFIHRISMFLLLAAVTTMGAEFATTDFSKAGPNPEFEEKDLNRPNIILLTSDGVEARFMSVYGFPYPTTPFLKKFATQSLLFENAFPSAGKTTGSLSSMLNGVLPSETHVGFPPQIFPKKHAALHLPAILQHLGYRGFQSSVRYYTDAGDLNMINSFDVANGRTLWTQTPNSLASRIAYLGSAEVQFLVRMSNRLSERLLHIFGIRPIINHYLLVTEGTGLDSSTDSVSLDDALTFASEQEGPFFLQVHLMASHCCSYSGTSEVFKPSDVPIPNEDAPENWIGYLNAIRDMDELYQKFISKLDAMGELENSIIVISSDHSQTWNSVYKMPLIVRFPQGQHQGRIERNVSLAQVPATILQYMGISQPEWMSQTSLLLTPPRGDELDAAVTLGGSPPILSLVSFEYSRFKLPGGHLSKIDNPGPPLYGVRVVGLVLGPYWKMLDLKTGDVWAGEVINHTKAAIIDDMPSDDLVRRYILRHMAQAGFQVPSSSWKIPVPPSQEN